MVSMKNNRTVTILLAVIVLLLAGLLSAVVLKNNDHMGSDIGVGMNHDMGEHMSGSKSSNNSNFTGADLMFLQMMIPHHQQAIDISELALQKSQNPELLTLAKVIISDQKSEIVQMKAWLDEAGASEDMGHSMSSMGGMLDAAELSALAKSYGKDFDTLWLKGMIGHHDGAIHMTQMIEDATNKEIKAFGLKIVKDQSAQIAQMKKMLG